MTNAADFAIFHFFRRSPFRWFLMAEILKIGVLGITFIFPVLLLFLLQFLHPIVKLIARIVSGPFRFLSRDLGRVNFFGKIWLQRRWRTGLILCLRAIQTRSQKNQYRNGPCNHGAKIANPQQKRRAVDIPHWRATKCSVAKTA